MSISRRRFCRQGTPATAAPPGLTQYVSEFIVNTKDEELPAEVLEFAKKSILDGFGLALAGSVSEHRHAVLEYLKELGSSGQASVIVVPGKRGQVPGVRRLRQVARGEVRSHHRSGPVAGKGA